jgi:hypothetical protein
MRLTSFNIAVIFTVFKFGLMQLRQVSDFLKVNEPVFSKGIYFDTIVELKFYPT